MNDLTDTGNVLSITAFIVQALALCFLAVKNERKALFSTNIVLLIGLVFGLISTLSSALFSSAEISSKGIFDNWIRLDGLSIYFLFIIQLVAIPTTIYNFSYLKHHIEQNKSIKSLNQINIFPFWTVQLPPITQWVFIMLGAERIKIFGSDILI